jgi:hypothetical protein
VCCFLNLKAIAKFGKPQRWQMWWGVVSHPRLRCYNLRDIRGQEVGEIQHERIDRYSLFMPIRGSLLSWPKLIDNNLPKIQHGGYLVIYTNWGEVSCVHVMWLSSCLIAMRFACIVVVLLACNNNKHHDDVNTPTFKILSLISFDDEFHELQCMS